MSSPLKFIHRFLEAFRFAWRRAKIKDLLVENLARLLMQQSAAGVHTPPWENYNERT